MKDAGFYVELYAAIAKQAGIVRTLDTELPAGVTAKWRTDGAIDYVFVQNFSGVEQSVELDGRAYTELESGEAVPAVLTLPVHALAILKRAH
ncbi:Beta-galactosidase BglY [compost metagenome]